MQRYWSGEIGVSVEPNGRITMGSSMDGVEVGGIYDYVLETVEALDRGSVY